MPPIQGVFKRYEKKYMLNREQYDAFMDAIGEYMTLDQYGLHTICNIYFDTDAYDLVRISNEKPIYKEKFRVRSYGVPTEDSMVFLEIKKKYKGEVGKRRVAAKLQDARAYLAGDRSAIPDSQILREITYMIEHDRLKPKVYLAYDRMAFFGKENPEIRMTIDQRIRFRETELSLTAGDHGTLLTKEELFLVEVKVPNAMPLWMTHILTDLKIAPASFSKYGTYFREEIMKKHNFFEEYIIGGTLQ